MKPITPITIEVAATCALLLAKCAFGVAMSWWVVFLPLLLPLGVLCLLPTILVAGIIILLVVLLALVILLSPLLIIALAIVSAAEIVSEIEH